jgi:hypothetical protein
MDLRDAETSSAGKFIRAMIFCSKIKCTVE